MTGSFTPLETRFETRGQNAIAEFRLQPDLFWFRGHFPIQPIVPGVAQLEWVVLYSGRAAGRPLGLSEVKQMKFTTPMKPGDETRLTLSREKSDGTVIPVRFRYEVKQKDGWAVASSGRVELTPRNA